MLCRISERNLFDNRQSVALEPHDFPRVVCEQADSADTELT